MPNDVRPDRIETIRAYFRKVDARDPTLLDLVTEDVELFFPKYGLVRGKAALAEFGTRLQTFLASLEHDIDGLNIIEAGDVIVVEGREWGVTRDGVSWPDGTISQGRFCNVFVFEGPLIRRTHIYVDPDFTSADRDRIRLLRGDAAAGGLARLIVERYFERLSNGATSEELAAMFSEEVDWHIPGPIDRIPWIGRRRGRQEIAAFFTDLRTRIEPIRFEIPSIVAEGDKAVATGELVSRVRETGKLIESEIAIAFTVKNGLIVRYRLYEDSFAVAQAANVDEI